jgi:hypothetical protein
MQIRTIAIESSTKTFYIFNVFRWCNDGGICGTFFLNGLDSDMIRTLPPQNSKPRKIRDLLDERLKFLEVAL